MGDSTGAGDSSNATPSASRTVPPTPAGPPGAGGHPGLLRRDRLADVGDVEPQGLHADLAGVAVRLSRGLGRDPFDELDSRGATATPGVVEEPRLARRGVTQPHRAGVLTLGTAAHLDAEPERLVDAHRAGEGRDV